MRLCIYNTCKCSYYVVNKRILINIKCCLKTKKKPKTKHMKYKKQKTQKTNLSDFYVKYCTGIYKFCPNYEQQKMKDNASKLN